MHERGEEGKIEGDDTYFSGLMQEVLKSEPYRKKKSDKQIHI